MDINFKTNRTPAVWAVLDMSKNNKERISVSLASWLLNTIETKESKMW